MKVLLSHGYFLEEDPKEKVIMKPYPPLGLLYVSAYLREHNIPNTIFDTTFSSKEKFKSHILNERPDVLALYINLMTKVNIIQLINWIRKQEQLRHTKIILGGPDVRYNAKNLLKHGADYLVIGEGEESCLELIKAIQDKKAISEIQGIGWKNEAGEMVINPERKKIREINELPWPARDQIDLQKYLDTWKTHHGQSAMSVSTMRGCPYTCKWCSRAVYGLSYRRRSAVKVVEELKHIQEKYKPDTIWFVDDVFTVSHKWLAEFVEEVQKANVKIKYECITRADRMNEEVIQMLKASGCFRVWIGAESGSQKIIDLMDRRVDVDKVREMIRLSRKNGIEAGTFIMLGYPGETLEDIHETINHLKTSDPDYFTITVAYPIRGTELFQEVESDVVTELDWDKTTDRQIDFKRTYNRRFYDFAIRKVYNEVWFNKKKIKKEHISISGLNLKLRSTAAGLGMWWEMRKGGSHAS